MTGIVSGKVDLAHKALIAVADWHDIQTKPPTVHRIWQRIHHECLVLTTDTGLPDLYPPVLGEAFRLLRETADCRYQQYLGNVFEGHRKAGTLGDFLHRAAGRSAS